MAEPLLAAQGLGHRYGAGSFLFRALDLAIGEGEILSVLGPNGRGKTTLLKCLAGVERPAEGAVARRADLSIAYVPQAARTGLAYRALDMVVMGRAAHLPLLSWPSAKDVAIAEAALARMGIGRLRDRAFQTLSGGEKSLVLIARALAASARLLILDEPMAALDIANQQTILATIGGLAREDGVAVIVTTHQPQHALALGGSALVLDAEVGPVLGAAHDVLDEALLSKIYRMPVARTPILREGRSCEAIVPMFTDGAD